MTKHPNAPAKSQIKRKRQNPVTIEEYDKIHALFNEGNGMKQIDIARMVNRATGSIAHILNRLDRDDVLSREGKRARKKSTRYKYEHTPLEEKDLSSLPDSVLFEHSKDYIL